MESSSIVTGKHKFMNLSQAIEETWNFNQAEAKTHANN